MPNSTRNQLQGVNVNESRRTAAVASASATSLAAGLRRISVWSARLASSFRKVWYRLSYPGIRFGKNVLIGRGVLLRATDGGTIVISDRVTIDRYTAIVTKGGAVTIGADTFIGAWCVVTACESIEIDQDVLIAPGAAILDCSHRHDDLARPIIVQGNESMPVTIARGVWIGTKATILKGTAIGQGAIIGAHSVVNKDVPAMHIAAGVPARVMRERNGVAGHE
jgi:acetyltransferase-like isoleucine patch superfamily enzyme